MTGSAHPPVVVVGVDGSPDSDTALAWAQGYARANGALLQVVVAWHWPTSYGYPIGYDGYSPEADAQELADKAVAGLDLPDERVRTVVVEGFAGPTLVSVSEQADLLVVGCHGHGALSSVLLGSVSAHCVHHASVPVVIVR